MTLNDKEWIKTVWFTYKLKQNRQKNNEKTNNSNTDNVNQIKNRIKALTWNRMNEWKNRTLKTLSQLQVFIKNAKFQFLYEIEMVH